MRHLTLSAFAAVAIAAAPVPARSFDLPDVTYPRLVKEAASPAGFVPRGWLLEKEFSGDLNRDGIADRVLLIRQNDPKNVIKHDALGENPFDSNPRILAVVFGRSSGAGYALALENHTLIPRREIPAASDPLEDPGGIAIERGALRIKLHHFMSAGGWSAWTVAYTFRHQNQRFELIGLDRSEMMRNSGEEREISINYSTGRMSITTTSMEDDTKKRVRWRTLPSRPLLTVDRIGNGLEFNPEK